MTSGPVRTSPAHDARLRTHQSGVCSCFNVNHDGNNWGKQLQQAAKCAVAHNPGPGTKVRVHCIDHAQSPFACTLLLMHVPVQTHYPQ